MYPSTLQTTRRRETRYTRGPVFTGR